jgi:hypothetical protein
MHMKLFDMLISHLNKNKHGKNVLTPEQKQARQERVRARRQNLTPEEREEINARRREKRQRSTLDERNASQRARRQRMTSERHERTARLRARRHSIPPEDQQALLINQCRANYATGQDTLCKESTASQCPSSSLMRYPASSTCTFSCADMWTQTSTTTQGNSHLHIPSICMHRDFTIINQ